MGSRLAVMRAEGVLRLILNTPLYAGMKPELTDRYVKFAIVEEGKIRNIAIRVNALSSSFRFELKLNFYCITDTECRRSQRALRSDAAVHPGKGQGRDSTAGTGAGGGGSCIESDLFEKDSDDTRRRTERE